MSKSWMATVNNYTDADIEWFKSLEGTNKLKMVSEIGEQGTPHLHVFITFRKTYRLEGLKKLHKKCNWTKGQADEMFGLNYCNKFEDSKLLYYSDKGNQGERNDLKTACETLKTKGLKELATTQPDIIVKYHKGLKVLKDLIEPVKDWYETKIYVYYGEAGTGKSKAVREKCKELNIELYNIPEPINGSLWFDGYEGQKAILLDDFYGWVKYHTLLQLTDGYAMKMPVKGGFINRQWEYVFITSNSKPDDWYNRSEIKALNRRITTITKL